MRYACQRTPISSMSSLKVLRNVFFGLPLFLLPSSGTQYISVWAGISLCSGRTWPASFLLLVVTMSWNRSMPALLITSSCIACSRHEMPIIGVDSGDGRLLACVRSWPFSSTSHMRKLPLGSHPPTPTDITLCSIRW